MVPVDVVINAIIILACVTAVDRPKNKRVCNIKTQSGTNTVTWIKATAMGTKYIGEYPLSYALWYPVAKAKNYKWEHKFDSFFHHTSPPYFIDLLLFIFGQKMFMLRVLKGLNKGLELLSYYVNRSWVFKNEYLRSLPQCISAKDNEIFFTNFEEMGSTSPPL